MAQNFWDKRNRPGAKSLVFMDENVIFMHGNSYFSCMIFFWFGNDGLKAHLHTKARARKKVFQGARHLQYSEDTYFLHQLTERQTATVCTNIHG